MFSIDRLWDKLARCEGELHAAHRRRMDAEELRFQRRLEEFELEREYCRDACSYWREQCERIEFLIEKELRREEDDERNYIELGDDITAPRKIGMDRKELRTIRHYYCKGSQRKLKNTKKRLLNRSHRYALKRACRTLNGRHTTRYRVAAWT